MSDIQQQLLDAKKDQILDAATAVIAQNGFQKTTVRQIAQRAGVADGTIYNYFKNKNALLVELVERLSQREMADIAQAQAETLDAETFIDTFVAGRMAEIDEVYDVLRAVLPETISDAALRKKIYDQVYAPGFSLAEQYIAQLQAQGEVDTAAPPVAARLISSPLLGLLLLRLLGDRHVTTHWATYTVALIDFLKKAIASKR